MLVDNTIVMLENIHRHQRAGERGAAAGENAAREINSAIVASTSTNLAAVLPFLFIGGLVGVLFRELIITISAAILASMVVALTLVPALGVKVHSGGSSRVRRLVDGAVHGLQAGYSAAVAWMLQRRVAQGLVVLGLAAALLATAPTFLTAAQQFLPEIDDGQLLLTLTADPGVSLEEMDRSVRRVEALLARQPEVQSVFGTIGGFIFGRTAREMSNSTTLTVQLVPPAARPMSSSEWIRGMNKTLKAEQMAGVRARLRARGIRGVRVGSGDDDVSLRIQGPDLTTLATLADEVVRRLGGIDGLSNVQHSSEEQQLELAVRVDRARATALGVDPKRIGDAVQLALNGAVVSDFFDRDRAYDIRVRLPRRQLGSVQNMEDLPLFVAGRMMRLREVARVELANAPSEIMRDNQRRVVEISGTVAADVVAGDVHNAIRARLADFVPPAGYALYDGGAYTALQEGRQLGGILLGLALFLVFVVMAVQYESLRNPLVILLSVPFSVIGVALALRFSALPLSMPVWLGMIMLAGIVVNNAIVLVEYVEIARSRGLGRDAAIVEAARIRLRPILMTTLTTVVGMLPLALGLGQGAELLQPLAVSLIGGLLFSLLVTLALVPILYRVVHWRAAGEA
jgi:multidrug efflux pump subunit AcrB